MLSFGPIKVILGEKKGKFPSVNSLFIDDDVKVLIDPGAGRAPLMEVCGRASIDLIFHTHYHIDHIAGNRFFERAKIYLNQYEAECFRSLREIARRMGILNVYGEEGVESWMERVSRPDTPQSPYSTEHRYEWYISSRRLDGTYRWGEIVDFGRVKMEIIGMPGHTDGFSCFYFPDHGVAYVGDYDLTRFGPWYGGSDGSIADYIASVEKIKRLDVTHYVTGHEAGVVSKEEFMARIDSYVEEIERRSRRIIELLRTPLTLAEIAGAGLIYGKPYLIDRWIYMFEYNMVEKHIKLLLQSGRVVQENGRYLAV